MLQRMRENAQGLVSKVIIGALVAVLALFGFGSFASFVGGDPVAAEVDGVEITERELEVASQRERRRILSRMGENADPSLIDDVALRQQVLDTLVTRALLLQEAERQDLGASPAQIAADVRSIEAFQFEGRFDQQLYLRRLNEGLYTHETFQRALREDAVLGALTAGVAGTALVTDADLERLAALTNQRRDLAWLSVPLERFRAEISVTDAEVAAWYDANPDQFLTEEQASVEYVLVSADGLVADVEVSDADVAAAWEAGKDSFSGGERRRSAHILIGTDERTEAEALALATELRGRLQAGEDFAALAEEYSEDPGSAARGGDLGFAGRGTFVPPFENALFALEEGELSAPVVSEFGVHIIRLDAVQEETYPTLDEQYPVLAEELRRDRARSAFEDLVARMEVLAFEDFGGLDNLAGEISREVQVLDPVLKSGSGAGLAGEPAVVRATFSEDVLDGYNSSVMRLSGDRAVVLRVAEHRPASRQPLEQVADAVRSRLLDEQARQQATAAAETAVAELASGDAVAGAVASRLGAEWQQTESASRSEQGVPGGVLRAAFQLPRPVGDDDKSVGTADLADAVAVVTVTRVVPGDYASLSDAERAGLRRVLQQQLAQGSIEGLQRTVLAGADVNR